MTEQEVQAPRAWRSLRVALIHDWLTGMRGGERVLEAICELLPQATIFTPVSYTHLTLPTILRV